MKYDPSLKMPVKVLEAALLVENWFKMKRIEEWFVGGICSKKMLQRAESDLKIAQSQIISLTGPNGE